MWVMKTALVSGVIFSITWSRSMPSVRGSMSTKTGLSPQWRTEAMSETQESVGTMISPPPNVWRMAAMVTRFADEPELTKTLCFTPSHSDHSRSKASTSRDCVRMGSVCCRKPMTASRSARVMLLDISGQGMGRLLFIMVVAPLDEKRRAPVLAFQRVLIGGENLLRLVEPDNVDVAAHEPERLREIADVLILRVQGPLRPDARADDDLRAKSVVGHPGELVEVVDDLVHRQQQEIPAREDADGNLAPKRQAGADPHLHFLGHRQFEQFFGRDVLESVRHRGAGARDRLPQENHVRVFRQELHGPLQLVEVTHGSRTGRAGPRPRGDTSTRNDSR